jgi:hypothetical protein
MKKHYLLFLLFCLGCGDKARITAIHISLTDNKQSLKITGIDSLIMQDINRDTVSTWQSLFAIYRMPADTSLKNYQPVQPGKYQLKGNAVIFNPDTAFAQQQTYFLRYYNYDGNKSVWDYITGKTRVGQLHYNDVIFKR